MHTLAAILEAVDVSLAVSLAAGAFCLGQYTRGATARVAALEKWRTETNAILATLTNHTTDHRRAIRAIYELPTAPSRNYDADARRDQNTEGTTNAAPHTAAAATVRSVAVIPPAAGP